MIGWNFAAGREWNISSKLCNKMILPGYRDQ